MKRRRPALFLLTVLATCCFAPACGGEATTDAAATSDEWADPWGWVDVLSDTELRVNYGYSECTHHARTDVSETATEVVLTAYSALNAVRPPASDGVSECDLDLSYAAAVVRLTQPLGDRKIVNGGCHHTTAEQPPVVCTMPEDVRRGPQVLPVNPAGPQAHPWEWVDVYGELELRVTYVYGACDNAVRAELAESADAVTITVIRTPDPAKDEDGDGLCATAYAGERLLLKEHLGERALRNGACFAPHAATHERRCDEPPDVRRGNRILPPVGIEPWSSPHGATAG